MGGSPLRRAYTWRAGWSVDLVMMNEKRIARWLCGGAMMALAIGSVDAAKHPLVVHEWGTFTVLQDPTGTAVPGVNINEEALPDFVHRLASDLVREEHELGPFLKSPSKASRPPIARSKGVARGHQYAIMRMETPIIYFYPPGGEELTLDVSVQFRKGWLSEWYPAAKNVSPGYPGRLGLGPAGSLTWKGLEVGVEAELPRTDEHVWLAPRVEGAATVRMPAENEAENYLFYRGVAQLQAPLRVVSDVEGSKLRLLANVPSALSDGARFDHLWLADIRPDGAVAFRTLDAIDVKAGGRGEVARTELGFDEEEYASANLAKLRRSMHAAITSAGLFEAEATAMLDTWELSYFKSPGMRLFFLLPEAWTDFQLPLKLSHPAEITRVMIGRVELMTPSQERLVAQIAAGPPSDRTWLEKGLEKLPEEEFEAIWRDLQSGAQSVTEVDEIEVPADYRAYLQLGRFRDAIVLQRADRSPRIRKFTETYGIRRN